MAATYSESIAVTHVNGHLESFSLPPQNVFLVAGRGEDCEVVLAENDASRRHVSFMHDGAQWYVVDQSSNGTVVNDQLVHRQGVCVAGEVTLNCGKTQIILPALEATLSKHTLPKNDGEGGWDETAVRKKIHRQILDSMRVEDVAALGAKNEIERDAVVSSIEHILENLSEDIPAGFDVETLKEELLDEILGLGPLESLLASDDVSEIMVVDSQTIFCERKGVIEKNKTTFTDDHALRAIIDRIVAPIGRRIDDSSPYVDARLSDGSRVNAVIAPIALKGSCITIRKFPKHRLGVDDLIAFDSLNNEMASFLQKVVKSKKNILISGGTGSGKTTLLNVLSSMIGEEERVVTIEDSAELQLAQEHVVSLESKNANMEGIGEVTIRHLVANALRMRPDRIIVGECRGGEAIDMLQAMNTGHDGSMTTLHANNPDQAIARLETLAMMAGLNLPVSAIKRQIASSVDIIVQQSRFSDGSRRITSITEVLGMNQKGELQTRELYGFMQKGVNQEGKVEGKYSSTGFLPSFYDELVVLGLCEAGEWV